MALGLIVFLKTYFVFVVVVMLLYAVRHAVFSYSRMFDRQRIYYSDVYDSEMPFVSVLIPMHNEEKVLEGLIKSLVDTDYDKDRLEIIMINDHSTDSTAEMLETCHHQYPFINVMHRDDGIAGKPAALNDALEIAVGEVIIIFDADYRPSRKMLSRLAIAFSNPEIGAVMGRVIPHNRTNLLTHLLSMERSGGYQADQQARYNRKLIPQYGGTVGGFRKSIVQETGGFNVNILAEDTELTFRLYMMGYKVIYANDAECYEESPETWRARGKQVRRWSRGHNATMYRYLFKLPFSKYLTFIEKVDGIFLLLIYLVPFLLILGIVDSLILFFAQEMNVVAGWWVLLFVGAYNSFGNFAPFYEIATGLMMDGNYKDIKKLPLMAFTFYFYLWNISLGFFDSLIDLILFRKVKWDKTERFTVKKATEG
jgi:cellulose synthase/poly-beta-1,6-N-acetylglucosamine synthase-like glycosyltransferase